MSHAWHGRGEITHTVKRKDTNKFLDQHDAGGVGNEVDSKSDLRVNASIYFQQFLRNKTTNRLRQFLQSLRFLLIECYSTPGVSRY